MNHQPTTLNASARADPMASWSWCFTDSRLDRTNARSNGTHRLGEQRSGLDRVRRPPTPWPASVVGLPRTDARWAGGQRRAVRAGLRWLPEPKLLRAVTRPAQLFPLAHGPRRTARLDWAWAQPLRHTVAFFSLSFRYVGSRHDSKMMQQPLRAGSYYC